MMESSDALIFRVGQLDTLGEAFTEHLADALRRAGHPPPLAGVLVRFRRCGEVLRAQSYRCAKWRDLRGMTDAHRPVAPVEVSKEEEEALQGVEAE